MFNAISVTSIFVLDQNQALDFYVGKLGFEVGRDIQNGPFRWLTVRVPEDPAHEVFLMQPGPPVMDEATAEQIRALVSKGAMSSLVLATSDCRKTAETLKARGVEFTQEPTEHGYGVDCGIRDPFGNAIRILQPKHARAAAGSR
ncbi:MAG TPA: VOC family protein [Candidatus Dormibacteraeota bacterium]|nr:VOC family protein [Candidatus Dormibacteraeota bacterium]